MPHAQGGALPWGDYLREVALYNVVLDPHEKHDLAAAEAERVKTLRRLLDAWWTPGDDSAVPKAR